MVDGELDASRGCAINVWLLLRGLPSWINPSNSQLWFMYPAFPSDPLCRIFSPFHLLWALIFLSDQQTPAFLPGSPCNLDYCGSLFSCSIKLRHAVACITCRTHVEPITPSKDRLYIHIDLYARDLSTTMSSALARPSRRSRSSFSGKNNFTENSSPPLNESGRRRCNYHHGLTL